jgi:hypothetical protein
MSVVLLGSTSGSVTLQEPAVAGSTVIDLPATSGTMAVLPTATSVLPQASGGTGTTTGYYGFKNRLINSAMVIDQRNAGAAITPSANGPAYTVDRWAYYNDQVSKLTYQQNYGTVTPPAGFKNYLGVYVASAATVGASDEFDLFQRIEGFNTADLGFGAAGASTITLSFWVRSTLTGTFGGVLANSANSRIYPFTYTISASNTWEQKSVTIAGDTSGTWVGATNGIGLTVLFSMGAGSTRLGTAGAWASTLYTGATGQVNLVATAGATFYITGVQLEKGSTATSFDYRPYGTELNLCMRYFQSYSFADASMIATGATTSTSAGNIPINLLVPMRTAPSTITIPSVGTSGGTWTPLNQAGGYPATLGTAVVSAPNPTQFRINISGFTGNYSGGGQAVWLYSAGASTMSVSAEL